MQCDSFNFFSFSFFPFLKSISLTVSWRLAGMHLSHMKVTQYKKCLLVASHLHTERDLLSMYEAYRDHSR